MLKCLLSSLFQIRGTYCWKRIRAVVVVVVILFFYLMYSVFECVRALKIKSQQCSMTEIKKEEVNDQTTEGAQPMLETLWKHLFIWCIFTFLHTISLRMMNCSQGINQKSVFYSFGNHPLTFSTNSVKQWRRNICNRLMYY